MTGAISRLHADFGQSPWLDALSRADLVNGRIDAMLTRGVRGLTTNPTIFHGAITGSDSYDEEISRLAAEGRSAEDICWRLICDDVANAADRLAALHRASGGEDGWVSIEVSPELADDAAGTVTAARQLRAALSRPNVMIKIPATRAGVEAVERCAAEGIDVNTTLIFGLDRYREVREAWWRGLALLAVDDPNRAAELRGVASFFVSRVDVAVDALLPEGSPLRTWTAIDQARLAYDDFAQAHAAAEWSPLASVGCHPQRLLWASTGTKDPTLPATRYVDELVGPLTVTTLPPATLEAYDRTEESAQRLTLGLPESVRRHAELRAAGVRIEDVSAQLESDGVTAFRASHRALVGAIGERSRAVGG